MVIEQKELAEKLAELRLEHRELDDAIVALAAGGVHDQLKLQRMKKKKLRLRDLILRIEALLEPDIIA